jgi:hypothetical protein
MHTWKIGILKVWEQLQQLSIRGLERSKGTALLIFPLREEFETEGRLGLTNSTTCFLSNTQIFPHINFFLSL